MEVGKSGRGAPEAITNTGVCIGAILSFSGSSLPCPYVLIPPLIPEVGVRKEGWGRERDHCAQIHSQYWYLYWCLYRASEVVVLLAHTSSDVRHQNC